MVYCAVGSILVPVIPRNDIAFWVAFVIVVVVALVLQLAIPERVEPGRRHCRIRGTPRPLDDRPADSGDDIAYGSDVGSVQADTASRRPRAWVSYRVGRFPGTDHSSDHPHVVGHR